MFFFFKKKDGIFSKNQLSGGTILYILKKTQYLRFSTKINIVTIELCFFKITFLIIIRFVNAPFLIFSKAAFPHAGSQRNNSIFSKFCWNNFFNLFYLGVDSNDLLELTKRKHRLRLKVHLLFIFRNYFFA